MKNNTPTPAEPTTPDQPDRLSRALEWSNELSEFRLREIENIYNKRWCLNARAEKRLVQKTIQSWRYSTGPRSAAGKAVSSRNALKGGAYTKAVRDFHAALTLQRKMLRAVRGYIGLQRRGPVLPSYERALTQKMGLVTRQLGMAIAFLVIDLRQSAAIKRKALKSTENTPMNTA